MRLRAPSPHPHLCVQLRRMMTQVIFDKGRNEKVSMIVSLVTPQREFLIHFLTCSLERFGIKLLFEEYIRHSLIDQNEAVIRLS